MTDVTPTPQGVLMLFVLNLIAISGLKGVSTQLINRIICDERHTLSFLVSYLILYFRRMTLQFEVLRISIICCQHETSLAFNLHGSDTSGTV
jgi:hypothetical protein